MTKQKKLIALFVIVAMMLVSVLPLAACGGGPSYGTADDPISISQAIALGEKECTEDKTFTAQEVYAVGKVTSVGSVGAKYLSSVVVADLTDTNKSILIYTLNVDSGVATPAQNDTIEFHGWIKNHEGTLEFANNSFKEEGADKETDHYVYATKNTRGTSTITVVNADNATVTGLPASATNGSAVTFTVTPPTGKQIAEVLINGVAKQEETDGSYKFTIVGNTIVKITTADAGVHVPKLVYTLDTNPSEGDKPSTGSNGYENSGTATVNGIAWVVEGNGTQNPWRLGGKSTNCVDKDRSITSKTALAQDICQIIIKFGDWSASTMIEVNSVTFKVYSSDPTATDSTAEPIFTKDITANSSSGGSVTITNEDGHWTNCFYQLTFNLTVKSTSTSTNYFVTVAAMEFYK